MLFNTLIDNKKKNYLKFICKFIYIYLSQKFYLILNLYLFNLK